MRILLTGSGGMVGRNILEHPDADKFEFLSPRSSELDLRNYDETKHYLSVHRPDWVIHSAGYVGGIQANMREPVRFLLDNMDMGRNIVWASYNSGIKHLINLGSSCMYPRNAPNPLTEDLILTGELEPTNEGYALAKIMTGRLCEYIHREQEEYNYKTIIPCNIYGRHDKFDPVHSHLIPAIIHKLHQAKVNNIGQVEIWGNGNARREFMYAGDLANCVIHGLSHFDTMPPVMNVGIGRDYTINDYYRITGEIIGYQGDFTHDLSRPVGMQQKLVSIEQSAHWGWHTSTSLEDGIQMTYDFYLQQDVSV